MNKLYLSLSVLAVCVAGCGTERRPISVDSNATRVALHPTEVIIKGPVLGSTRSFSLLGFNFSTLSFGEAERAALKLQRADVLLDSYRYIGIEGIPLPFGELLNDGQPVPLIGYTSYNVEGMAATLTKERPHSGGVAQQEQWNYPPPH